MASGPGLEPLTRVASALGLPGELLDTSYASLSAAVTAIGSTVSTLRIATPLFPNGATVTVPPTLTLEFVGNGSLTLTTGQTVTIQSDTSQWPIRKIFNNALAGQGTVSFAGNKVVTSVRPEWWGALSADDAAIFAAAITAKPVIALSRDANYTINTAVTAFNSTTRGKIIGNGATINTTLNDAVFWINSVAGFEAERVRFVGNFAGTFNNQHAFASNPSGNDLNIHHCIFESIVGPIFVGNSGTRYKINDNLFLLNGAEIQFGSGVRTVIEIMRNRFTGTSTLHRDDVIALSGCNSDVIVAYNWVDCGGTFASGNLHGEGVLVESSESGQTPKKIKIFGNIFKNMPSGHALGTNVAGINVTANSGGLDPQDVKIVYNTIENVNYGILIQNAGTGLVIKTNTIRTTSSGFDGITLTNTGADAQIEGNNVYSAGNNGIKVSNPARPRIVNNFVDDVDLHGIIIVGTSHDATVEANTVTNCGFDGIQTATNNTIIDDNHLIGNGRYGVNLVGTAAKLGINHYLNNATAPVNNYAAQLPTLVIASGVITLAGYSGDIIVDTESAAATDDLDTINGGAAGDVIVLRPANSVRDVTVKHGTGNIICGSDFTLVSTNDRIALKYDGTNWYQLSRSTN